MKKNQNRKGFTIVELVIVIAVIAILAAVLIPTFSGVIDTANESAALQKATAAYKEAYAKVLSDGTITDGENGEAQNFKFIFAADGSFTDVTEPTGFGYTVSWDAGKVKVSK